MNDQDIDTAGTEADEEMNEPLSRPDAKPIDPTKGPLGQEEEPPDTPPGQSSSSGESSSSGQSSPSGQ
ncbi:MAG: hypothetical protein IT178_07630 [Acidobacteria bacterium]|nr:hypothetical protein [Acidobacteriota bacterium]